MLWRLKSYSDDKLTCARRLSINNSKSELTNFSLLLNSCSIEGYHVVKWLTNDRDAGWPDDARWQQMKVVRLAFDHHSVSSVVATLENILYNPSFFHDETGF